MSEKFLANQDLTPMLDWLVELIFMNVSTYRRPLVLKQMALSATFSSIFRVLERFFVSHTKTVQQTWLYLLW